jgi:hypothetical protein
VNVDGAVGALGDHGGEGAAGRWQHALDGGGGGGVVAAPDAGRTQQWLRPPAVGGVHGFRRQCRSCGVEKGYHAFGAASSAPDGMASVCLECEQGCVQLVCRGHTEGSVCHGTQAAAAVPFGVLVAVGLSLQQNSVCCRGGQCLPSPPVPSPE